MILDNNGPDESAFFSPDDVPTSEGVEAEASNDEPEEGEPVEGDDDDNPEPELDENGDPIAKADADDDQPSDEEFEEIEHAGKKHKIPKDLKPLLMMQQDYTRKTQETAAERKAVEEYRAQSEAYIRHQAESVQQFTTEIAQLHNIDQRLAEYASVDWKAWEAQDFMAANAGWKEREMLKEQRGSLTQSLQQKQIQAREENEKRSREAQQLEQQELAKRHEETLQTLKRDIPSWNPEIAGKVSGFALSQGYTREELVRAAADPRAMKLLHKAWRGDQLEAQQKAAAKKAQADIQPQGRPLTPVAKGRSAPATAGLDDRLSADEWARRRNEQLRSRAR